MSRLYFLPGSSCHVFISPQWRKIVGSPIIHTRDVIKTDTLYVDKATPNFQLENIK